MDTRQLKRSKGMSLIEVTIAIAILTVVMVGYLVHRYYTILDEKEAEEQTAASRIATLLCESWRGVKGAEDYDPVAHLSPDLRIVSVTSTNTEPVYSYSDDEGSDDNGSDDDFNLLGRYAVSLEDQKYHVALAWKDVSTNLRALGVVVNRRHFDRMLQDDSYQRATETGMSDDDNIDSEQFKLTTYVATD